MDDVRRPDEADGNTAPLEPPSDFFKMRLRLQPGGLIVELDRPDMLVGRHTSADVRLPLPDVSRRHCRFVFARGRWHVVDLDSLNGVWLNERRISQAFLEPGDVLRLGGFHFEVDLSAAPVNPEPPSVLRSIFKTMPARPDSSHRQRKAS
jgi:pSer/pThr/pTyr-binding forkhead associated (FHA) protein